MNPELRYQASIAEIDDLHRHGAQQRLVRQGRGMERRGNWSRRWLPRLGRAPHPRGRFA